MKLMAACLTLATGLLTCTGESNRLIPFQCKLSGPTGTPLPDGQALLQFQIFGDATKDTLLWTGEIHRVTINGGLVNVMLGTKNPLPKDRIDQPDKSFFDQTLYLQIRRDSNGNDKIDDKDENLTPRQAILPVVFAEEAANSRKLEGHDWKEIANALNPVGTIIAFAGDPSNPPKGNWLLCDGAEVKRGDYPELFGAIKTYWGPGNGVDTFHLPDLRGFFMRGVDSTPEGSRDPDRNNRLSIRPGANAGAKVGSYEWDVFAEHDHGGKTTEADLSGTNGYRDYNTSIPSNPNNPFCIQYRLDQQVAGNRLSEHTHGIAKEGGKETRPKNVYVNYFIKF